MEGSTDYDVQINHEGYLDANKPVSICPLDNYDSLDTYWPAVRALIHDSKEVLDICTQASSSTDYIILGIDVIFKDDGTVRIIEINTSPNLIHTATINQKVNVPLIEAVLNTMTGGHADTLEQI